MSKKAHYLHSDRNEKGQYLKGVPRKKTERKRRSPAKTYDDIMRVFELAGDVRAMAKWARKHPTAFYTQVLPRALPQAIMQKIWTETETEIKPEDKILFVEAGAIQDNRRVRQLEKLLKEHEIALPPKNTSVMLPEHIESSYDATATEDEEATESNSTQEEDETPLAASKRRWQEQEDRAAKIKRGKEIDKALADQDEWAITGKD